MSRVERELEEYDKEQSWHLVYQRVKNESAMKSIQEQLSVQEARKPENRGKNRYRDVSPYDHSRIVLKRGETDYINASLIQVPESNRRYILSQGPLEHTAGEFWQMVWEQESKAVIMLNKVIEKGTLKCHQYWPVGEEYGADEELVFEENNVKVILLDERTYDHYIVRLLEIENLEMGVYKGKTSKGLYLTTAKHRRIHSRHVYNYPRKEKHIFSKSLTPCRRSTPHSQKIQSPFKRRTQLSVSFLSPVRRSTPHPVVSKRRIVSSVKKISPAKSSFKSPLRKKLCSSLRKNTFTPTRSKRSLTYGPLDSTHRPSGVQEVSLKEESIFGSDAEDESTQQPSWVHEDSLREESIYGGDAEDTILYSDDCSGTSSDSSCDKLNEPAGGSDTRQKAYVWNQETRERREVSHYQYVTWPDFGVPSSPITFLNFLMAVRESGVLESDVGPAIIHCSAGIGRSGTFCLVDSCLILIEKSNDMNSIDVKSVLLNMRSYRMGLIQTPDQLRFSYLAIIAGGKRILSGTGTSSVNNVLETYKNMSEHLNAGDQPPPPPKRTSSLSPTKGDRPPPPPPPRKHEHGLDINGEPDMKHRKLENEDLPPLKPPRVDSPDKSKSLDNLRNDKPPDSLEVTRNSELTDHDKHETLGTETRDPVESNPTTDTNSNPVDDVGKDKRGGNTGGRGNEVEQPLQEHGPVQGGEQNETGAVMGNSAGQALSETELRRRKREERKKNTQELIKNMKEKQRNSETWKKRRSYFKPIAIGLSILIGGILLYKFYW